MLKCKQSHLNDIRPCCVIIALSNVLFFSMFSQPSPPHFAQQTAAGMYNTNMNINVSMATNGNGMNSMNQMAGQINMTSVTSVPTSGLSSMGPEQVSTINHRTLYVCII